jgi:4-amino-4-deoxy-L-arabinose transferase-like glycosyltransferase
LNYHANILIGQTDSHRTPVYPYFIKLIGLFGHQNLINNIVTAQIVVSFLSIILFYRIVRGVFKGPAVIFAASLLYGAMLPVINFDKMVLTESLSVTCILVFIYLSVCYLKRPNHLKAWTLTLYVFIAIMLRPSFVYLLPLAGFFWLIRLIIRRDEWKLCLSGLAASLVVILLINGYAGLNKKNTGFYGLSDVGNKNEIRVVASAGIYMYGNDPEISSVIKKSLDSLQEPIYKPDAGETVTLRFKPERVQKFIVTCLKNKPVIYLLYIGGKFIDLQSTNIFTNYPAHKLSFLAFRINNIEYLLFCVTFNLLYIFIVLSTISALVWWVRSKQTPWFKIILVGLCILQVLIAIMGADAEYPRLILPAMPALIILLFYHIDRIGFAIDGEVLKRYPASV